MTDFDADKPVAPLRRAGGPRYGMTDKALAGAGILLAMMAAFFPWYVFLNPDKFSVPALWEGNTRDLPETAAREVMSVSPAAMVDDDSEVPTAGSIRFRPQPYPARARRRRRACPVTPPSTSRCRSRRASD